jgi:hypothetical protein
LIGRSIAASQSAAIKTTHRIGHIGQGGWESARQV